MEIPNKYACFVPLVWRYTAIWSICYIK